MLGLPKLYNDNTINDLLTGKSDKYKIARYYNNIGSFGSDSPGWPTAKGLEQYINARKRHKFLVYIKSKILTITKEFTTDLQCGAIFTGTSGINSLSNYSSNEVGATYERAEILTSSGNLTHTYFYGVGNNTDGSCGTAEFNCAVVDLTDIFGFNEEPTTTTADKCKALIAYINKVGFNNASSAWLVNNEIWTWKKWFNANGTYGGADKRMAHIEKNVSCSSGDTITVQLTTQPEITLGLLYEWASDGTFVKRTVLMGGSGTVSWTATAEANTAYVTLTLYNNANLEMTPAALTAANVSITAESPAPSHAITINYPVTLDTDRYGSITITGPGTFTSTGEYGNTTLVVDNNHNCEWTITDTQIIESIGQAIVQLETDEGSDNFSVSGNALAGKKYVVSSNISSKVAEGMLMIMYDAKKHSTSETDYVYSSITYYDETPHIATLDCTDLSAGDYYEPSGWTGQNRLSIGVMGVEIDGDNVTYYDTYTIKFALALDEVE